MSVVILVQIALIATSHAHDAHPVEVNGEGSIACKHGKQYDRKTDSGCICDVGWTGAQCDMQSLFVAEVIVTTGGCSLCNSESTSAAVCVGPTAGLCKASCSLRGPFDVSSVYSCNVTLPGGAYYAQLSSASVDGVGLSRISMMVDNNLRAEMSMAPSCGGEDDQEDYFWLDGDQGCPQPTLFFSV